MVHPGRDAAALGYFDRDRPRPQPRQRVEANAGQHLSYRLARCVGRCGHGNADRNRLDRLLNWRCSGLGDSKQLKQVIPLAGNVEPRLAVLRPDLRSRDIFSESEQRPIQRTEPHDDGFATPSEWGYLLRCGIS